MKPDTTKMVKIRDMSSSALEDREDLSKLALRARQFLESHKWCKRIVEGWLDKGWEYMLGVFYFEFEPATDDVPNDVWVIVGDVPPARIDAEDHPNGACAIEGYVYEMQRWVDAVLEGKPVDDLLPVNVPPEEKYAKMLQSRLDFIQEHFLAELTVELSECPDTF